MSPTPLKAPEPSRVDTSTPPPDGPITMTGALGRVHRAWWRLASTATPVTVDNSDLYLVCQVVGCLAQYRLIRQKGEPIHGIDEKKALQQLTLAIDAATLEHGRSR